MERCLWNPLCGTVVGEKSGLNFKHGTFCGGVMIWPIIDLTGNSQIELLQRMGIFGSKRGILTTSGASF